MRRKLFTLLTIVLCGIVSAVIIAPLVNQNPNNAMPLSLLAAITGIIILVRGQKIIIYLMHQMADPLKCPHRWLTEDVDNEIVDRFMFRPNPRMAKCIFCGRTLREVGELEQREHDAQKVVNDFMKFMEENGLNETPDDKEIKSQLTKIKEEKNENR